jgi:hypothetical protein
MLVSRLSARTPSELQLLTHRHAIRLVCAATTAAHAIFAAGHLRIGKSCARALDRPATHRFVDVLIAIGVRPKEAVVLENTALSTQGTDPISVFIRGTRSDDLVQIVTEPCRRRLV